MYRRRNKIQEYLILNKLQILHFHLIRCFSSAWSTNTSKMEFPNVRHISWPLQICITIFMEMTGAFCMRQTYTPCFFLQPMRNMNYNFIHEVCMNDTLNVSLSLFAFVCCMLIFLVKLIKILQSGVQSVQSYQVTKT